MAKNFGNNLAATQPLKRVGTKSGERGAALATSLIILTLLGAISMTVLAVVTNESRIAGSDLQRTQTFYASAASIEKMTADFCALFNQTSRPTTTQLNNIAAAYPIELTGEGFSFTKADGTPDQSLVPDPSGATGTVTIPTGPFSGLVASVTPYVLTSTATQTATGTQVSLQRRVNNYLVPIFQFGMFSNEDMEIHPGPPFAFNGRVHANGNLYISGAATFLSKVTTANEIVTDVLRNGSTHAESMSVTVGSINVALTQGSMFNGPNISGATPGLRGYFPGSPTGTANGLWDTASVAAAQAGVPNTFGGQVVTRTTGGATLRLPLELDGFSARELIKRKMPNDTQTLSDSRYHSKSQIRILIDDEVPAAGDAAGIPAGQGVTLSNFDPIPLPNGAPIPGPAANGGGRALWRVNDNNTNVATSYNETPTSFVQQQQNGAAPQADTVRGVKAPPTPKAITGATNANPIVITSTGHGFSNGDLVVVNGVGGNTNANGEYTISNVTANTFRLVGRSGNAAYTANTGSVYALTKSANGTVIPSGAGITGRILIQIVAPNGAIFDVTQQILSMGMTEGEPNTIVALQRPLWAAFVQASRDASGSTNPALNGDPVYSNTLVDILTNTHVGADGEIKVDSTNGYPTQDSTYGYLTKVVDDAASGSQGQRSDVQPTLNVADFGTSTWNTNKEWNAVVPINVYNVREGLINSALTQNAVYDRGITNMVEINMRNLARWMDGVYNNNLLAGTNAVSTNIASPDGYTVYVSDRRGDRVKATVDLSGAAVNSSNGMVDNEDIYQNGTLDPGEDVQATGTLVKDTNELPDPAVLSGTSGADFTARTERAISVAAWSNLIGGGGADAKNHKYFRGAVRVFNGENLQVPGAAVQNLTTTLGITISSENMVYILGNYNTTGINTAPPDGTSALNDSTKPYYYLGSQVPSSIVCDAIFPLSKTFFDAETAIYPDDLSKRLADSGGMTVATETSMRAAIIAGNNLSALSGTPDAGNSSANESRLNGGMHNFPRFLESWGGRCNFVGSFIPLYHSTQALGQYNANSTIYGAPIRDWAFDDTFKDPTKLPPGTPLFQYIEPTGFKQVL